MIFASENLGLKSSACRKRTFNLDYLYLSSVWFDFFFYDMSTFMGYFVSKKNNSGIIQHITEVKKGVQYFSKRISRKVTRLEFERAYYDVAAQQAIWTRWRLLYLC